jgi:dTDP-glucose pyrophosphorylase
MINVVIPMAGAGSRFAKAGFTTPKPFISVGGRMMIERVLDGVRASGAKYTLVIREDFLSGQAAELDALAKKYPLSFATVERLTVGAAATALAAHETINSDIPVVFADSDNFFDNAKFNAFISDCLSRGLDGSLLTFPSDKECFSYARTDADGIVLETREKEVVSNHAIAGAYMFARGSDFVKCAIDMLVYGDMTKNEYYMSNAYNWGVRRGMKFGIFDIAETDFACVGTPEQLAEYLTAKGIG